MVSRRSLLMSAAASAVASFAHAQSWPARPVRIIVPFPAGGPTDFVVRLMTTALAATLGQPVVVENRPGASGNTGNQLVVDGEADGYTLVHNTVGVQAVNPLMYPGARFHPQKDLIGIATTASMPNVLVVNPAKLPVNNLGELIALGRQQANKLTCANFGSGTSAHIYGALLQKAGGFQAVDVPYKGSALALNDVIAGHVDFLFSNMTTAVSHVNAGVLKGLAITSNTRSRLLPDVPTMAQAGLPTLDLKFWFALFAHARTPPAIVERLQAAVAQAMADPAYAEALRERGADPLVTPRKELANFLATDTQRWAAAAQQIGVKPQT